MFWHAARSGVENAVYEATLVRFHAALAAHPPAGFICSFTSRTSRLPWLDADVAYEDWYLVADSAALDPLDAAAVDASEEFLGQRDDDARRTSHVAESVHVLVLGHLADQFGAVGAQATDSVVDAFDCKHDAPEAQRVRRCDRRFDLDQFWIAKLRQLKPPLPLWGPHHNDVDLDTFEPVDAVHPRALDRHLAFDSHAERGEKSDSGCKVVDDDADVIQSLDRHALV